MIVSLYDNTKLSSHELNEMKGAILKVLSYFDIFHYPLTVDEIRSFVNILCVPFQLSYCLEELLKDQIIFEDRGFYSLQSNLSLTTQRIKENAAAEKQLKLAKQVASFLTWFPFIRGIAISGSLSKQVAKKDSDIDFFVITKENRLWIAELFLRFMIKCASILGLDKWFCVNYMVDETRLEVPEKNIFTATEIITLLPVYGTTVFNRFIEANTWVYSFFPNHLLFSNNARELKKTFPQKVIEYFFKGKLGDRADDAIVNYFSRRWRILITKNKFKKTGFQIGAVMADKHFCRPYPQHFQRKILELYDKKLKDLDLTSLTTTNKESISFP